MTVTYFNNKHLEVVFFWSFSSYGILGKSGQPVVEKKTFKFLGLRSIDM